MAVQQHVLNWLYSVLTSEYHDVNRTYHDIATVLAQYPSLAPRTDAHTFDNGVSALLLHLSGTVPVVFRGTTYRFPIAIWVPHAYPREPPLVYVTPNEAMMVRPGQHVDPQGRVYHPYLTAWPTFWDKSTVVDLLGIIRDVFAKEPPVVARTQGQAQAHMQGQTAQAPPAPTPPPIPPHPSTSSPGHPMQPQIPAHSGRPPPPPPKGDQGASRHGGPPLPPLPPGHRGSTHSSYAASPVQSPQPGPSRYDRAPPLPPQQGSQAAPLPYRQHPGQHQHPLQHQQHHNHQTPAQHQHHGQPPYQQSPPPAFHAHGQPGHHDPRHAMASPPVGQPHPGAQLGVPPAGGYPGPPPPVGWQQSQHPQPPHQHQQYQQPPQQVPPFTHQQQQQQQQRAPPPPDIMDEPLTLALPSDSSMPAAPPIPPNPEKDALLRQLAVTLYNMRQHARQQNESSLAGLAAQKQAMLNGLQNLQSDAASLGPISAMLSSNTAILQSSLRQADDLIAQTKSQPKPQIDELLVAPTVVGNQLYDLVAEERALGDAIFVLGRAVERGNLSPQVFAKTTRSLAREWYLKKALVRKIARGMGLIV
ncbi:UEV domain-domain-containing protein [Microdochium bolleyi]|uniref:UEV domain-domain-containing protein n=1 Tax=Microdochium bolleyi TaxID=196109 RepID=A0A136JD18_9PEZI|nr:UEV domain-domain-containing protein [Microdochium bolleyi]